MLRDWFHLESDLYRCQYEFSSAFHKLAEGERGVNPRPSIGERFPPTIDAIICDFAAVSREIVNMHASSTLLPTMTGPWAFRMRALESPIFFAAILPCVLFQIRVLASFEKYVGSSTSS